MSLIAVKGLSSGYGQGPVITGIDFALEPGEIVTIVGPNGSGKSTFVRTLLGIIPPSKGQVDRKPDLKIGYVPQRLTFETAMPLTVARFLSLPVRRDRATVLAALERTGVPDIADRQLRNVVRRAIAAGEPCARAANDPDVLILDEPTQGLDQPAIAAFYKLIQEVRRDHGCAVLMVSHDLHVVMSASNRVICLNGHICCEGAPQAVSEAPEYRALFGFDTDGAFALYPHSHDHHHHPHHDV